MWGGGKCRTLAGAEAGPGELSQELISSYPHLECAITTCLQTGFW